MAEGPSISALAGGMRAGMPISQTPQASAAMPEAPSSGALGSSTGYVAAPVDVGAGQSKVVQRLLQQQATVYAPGLARIPLPARPDDVPRAMPKKAAGPMVAPRTLDGGRSPLAPATLQDARSSFDAIGEQPSRSGDQSALADAKDGAYRMPSRHGLVAYTTTARGDRVYLTQERWLHIRQNHMDAAPQPRGKRTTTYWPTRHAVDGPSMTEQQVIGVIVDAARKGVLRTEVRDTRMAEYDLPADQREAYGVSEAKVSMAPDGLVLSAYPGAGDNVLAVYELDADDHAALAKVTAQAANAVAAAQVQRGPLHSALAATRFG